MAVLQAGKACTATLQSNPLHPVDPVDRIQPGLDRLGSVHPWLVALLGDCRQAGLAGAARRSVVRGPLTENADTSISVALCRPELSA